MNSFLRKNHRILFFVSWLIINLIQAYETELIDDEAYYWIYSQYPAWGYFDHPPMIAILIRLGYLVFPNEFGVRLLVVILNTATIYLLSLLINNRSERLFYSITGSIAIAQIGGIIAVPDTPLLFFVSLFFLQYNRFLKKMNLANSVLLGVSIALMLYTKYHGVLVVFFTLLSNLKLFSRYQTYLVAVIAILLFAPHLYWQYMHGFPSVQYHLFERNASSYRINFTLDYLAGQIVLAGPIVGWLLIWGSMRYKTSTAIEKALKFTLAGFYIFFLISTFKGRVEANWTIPAFVAIIVLSHQYLNRNPRMARWVYWSLPVTLILVVFLRIYMMIDGETAVKIPRNEFHQNRETAQIVSKAAAGLPVVFTDSYQRPSKHWFYSRQPVVGLNTPYYRRTNYNFWPTEDSFFTKRVFVVGDYDSAVFNNRIVAPRLKNMGTVIVPFYYSFMKAQFSKVENQIISDRIRCEFDVEVPEKYLAYFQKTPFDTACIQLALLANNYIWYFPSSVKVKGLKQPSSHISAEFPLPLRKGIYEARLGISSGVPGKPSLNSASFRLSIP